MRCITPSGNLGKENMNFKFIGFKKNSHSDHCILTPYIKKDRKIISKTTISSSEIRIYHLKTIFLSGLAVLKNKICSEMMADFLRGTFIY